MEKRMDEQYQDSYVVEQLEKIGIDTKVGIKYCGDLEFYREILKISVEMSEEKMSSIVRYYKNRDYKNYTIVVHSIKSSAANIGAMELSDMARMLEYAGKEDNFDYIEKNNDSFLKCYNQVMQGIAQVLNIESESVKIEGSNRISREKWEDMLGKITCNLDELELDLAEELVDELLSCKLSPESQGLVLDIKKHLQHFDVEGAKEKLALL